MTLTRRQFLMGLLTATTLSGCRKKKVQELQPAAFPITTVYTPAQIASAKQLTTHPVKFTDVTSLAGINWIYNNGASGHHYFLETAGGGLAFLDYNNDGYLDIFALQGGPVPGGIQNGKTFSTESVLYRNNGDGTFTDVTKDSGLDGNLGYGMAVSVADFNNDGFPDLYITTYGGNRLFKNNGNGTFTDVTKRAGLADTEGTLLPFPLSAVWGDYDNDGYLDLFVCHYTQWSVKLDQSCPLRGEPSYCKPQVYSPSYCSLYHNNGDGTFTNITKSSGIDKLQGKSMSGVWFDYDDDGWIDLFVTNDTMPNFLLHNNRNGTFTNVALEAGVAIGANGELESGMGIAAGDYFHTGREDLVVVNFSGEPKSVYVNIGSGLFQNETYESNMASTNLEFLGFGLDSLDYDLDGYLDFVVGNGHVLDHIEMLGEGASYAQSQQLFHNQGKGTFAEDILSLGDLAKPRVTRGLAIGDFDNDGDQDVVMIGQNEPLQLFRNDGGNQNNWVVLRLEGVHSNRDAIGAKVTVHAANGIQTGWINGGGSYVSHSDTRLTFGLADSKTIESIEIKWPRGLKQHFGPIKCNGFYWVREGGDIVPDPRVKQKLASAKV